MKANIGLFITAIGTACAAGEPDYGPLPGGVPPPESVGLGEGLPDAGSGGGGCGPEFSEPIVPYLPGSYEGRDFLSPPNHLGEDIAAIEGTPVAAMGDGRIVIYQPADGYGELVVVIEHELDRRHTFQNGAEELVETQYLLSIYGHLRDSERPTTPALDWRVGNLVRGGEVIGYVNDDAHNGDGAEHLHLGVRLMNADQAREADPSAWFRGYDTAEGLFRSHFGRPQGVLEHMQIAADSCNTLCDESEASEGSKGHKPETPLPEDPPPAEDPPAEDPPADEPPAEDPPEEEPPADEPPAEDPPAEDPPAEDPPEEEPPCENSPVEDPPADEPPAEDPPAGGGADASDNTIDCEVLGGTLAITVRGDLNDETLVGPPLPGIGFFSIGSDLTGWTTSTEPPAYFAIWNGPAFPHTLNVPASIRRFNLWAAGPAGTRWFNLFAWTASGAGCRIVDDGLGGLVIIR